MYIKKPNQIKIKCFQFNCVNWSNLYLGSVPLVPIANKQIISVLKIKIIYGSQIYYKIFIKEYKLSNQQQRIRK